MVQRSVKKKQYPLTAAYAFTDYRSQGQTIPYVVVDIATPQEKDSVSSIVSTLHCHGVQVGTQTGCRGILTILTISCLRSDMIWHQEDERLDEMDTDYELAYLRF